MILTLEKKGRQGWREKRLQKGWQRRQGKREEIKIIKTINKIIIQFIPTHCNKSQSESVFGLTVFKHIIWPIWYGDFSSECLNISSTKETLEIEISRDEQPMNTIERMEKFRCDDSDDEWPSILPSSLNNFSYIFTINIKLISGIHGPGPRTWLIF